MKNQAIKGQSCLTLEKLSENELEAIVGGGDVFDATLEFVKDGSEKFLAGFMSVPSAFWGTCTGKDLLNADTTVDQFDSAFIFTGALTFIGLLDVVLWGYYYAVCKINKKLKRKSVNKAAH